MRKSFDGEGVEGEAGARSEEAGGRIALDLPFLPFSTLNGILQRGGSPPPSVGRLLRGRTKNCSPMYNELEIYGRISANARRL